MKNKNLVTSFGREAKKSNEVEEPNIPLNALGDCSDNIYKDALLCRQLFDEYLSQDRIHRHDVAILHRKFLTWAGFLGVFAPIQVSLDKRLYQAPEIKELVTSMLELLNMSLERGLKRHPLTKESNPGPHEKDGAMMGISGSVDRLSRLALMIRAPAKPDDVEKILQHKRKRAPDFFGEVAMALVSNRFPSDVMAEALQTQLASSVAYRRDRLIYQYRREAKFSAHRDDHAISETDFSKMSMRAGGAVMDELTPQQEHQGETEPPDFLQTSLNKAKGQESLIKGRSGNILRQNDPVSETSSSRSNNPWVSGEYPKAPQDGKCTICGKSLQKKISTDKGLWKKHVDCDLKPYVCISKKCGNLPPVFETHELWHSHMSTKHSKDWIDNIPRPPKWLCSKGHDATYKFDREEDLLDHLKAFHDRDLTERDFKLVASSHTMPDSLNNRTCPFCGEYPKLYPNSGALVYDSTREKSLCGKISSTEQVISDPGDDRTLSLTDNRLTATPIILSKHIGYHLKYIALWSLRWWGDDSGNSSDHDNHGHVNSSHGKATGSNENISLPEDELPSLQNPFPIPGQDVLPPDFSIDNLVNMESIVTKIPDLLDDEAGSRLATYIVERAQKVFAILAVHCDLEPQDLLTTMLHISTHSFTDEDLPVICDFDELVNSGSPGTFESLPKALWTAKKMGQFLLNQWRYLASAIDIEICRDNLIMGSNRLPIRYASLSDGGSIIPISNAVTGTASAAGILRNKMMEERRGSDNASFLPTDKIESFSESEIIVEVLQELTTDRSLAKKWERYILTKPAKRHFLLLVFCGKVEWIKHLAESKFHAGDSDLPYDNDGFMIKIPFLDNQTPEEEDLTAKMLINTMQWLFLAPVFTKNEFYRELDQRVPLPFLKIFRPTSSGAFSSVRKAVLHKAHQNGIIQGDGNDLEVALKEMTVLEHHWFLREIEVLRIVQSIVLENRNLHLVTPISSYKLGDDKCYLLFPWAENGNLRSFWGEAESEKGVVRQSKPDMTLDKMLWVLEQMRGLCEALAELHRHRFHQGSETGNCRHGDLKPENILVFREGGINVLRIADFGLAKFHVKSTSSRRRANKYTNTVAGTTQYLPPEFNVNRQISIKHDVWSLGCIFLEFIIWTAGGTEGLDKFVRLDNDEFWQKRSNPQDVVHDNIKVWIDNMKEVLLPGTALGDVLNLVTSDMLKRLEDRSSSERVLAQLKDIFDKSRADEDYCLSSDQKAKITGQEVTLMKNEWNSHTSNDLA